VSEDGNRFRTYLEVAAGIVTVLAVVVPAGIFLADQIGVTDIPVASRSAAAPPAPTAAPAAEVYLNTLRPDTGSTNTIDMPRKLRGQPGYDHPLPIACGSNEVGDQQRDVTYDLGGRYRSMRATVRPYKEISDESRVEVTAYPDNRTLAAVRVDVNSSQEIAVDLDGTKTLTIRVVCERPGAVAVLADAVLSRA
jgi:hypothetical protein